MQSKVFIKAMKFKILQCLFHLIQTLWRKMSKLGLRKKEYTTDTKKNNIIFKITSIYAF